MLVLALARPGGRARARLSPAKLARGGRNVAILESRSNREAQSCVRVIKTRKGAIAETGTAGRKLQVKGNDPAKAVKLLKALGFSVACQAQ